MSTGDCKTASITEVVLRTSSLTATFYTTLLMLLPLRSSHCCEFPGFLQFQERLEQASAPTSTSTNPQDFSPRTNTTSQRRTATENYAKWRWKITSQNTAHQMDVYVRGNLIIFVPLQTAAFQSQQYNRTCVAVLDAGKYLVAHEQKNATRTYLCTQFVLRTSGVVQLRTSSSFVNEAGDPSPACSDETMMLESWILMADGAVGHDAPRSSRICGLSGGFGVRMFDRAKHQGACDGGYRGETRIESDCTRGDGMRFHFRHESCVPEGLYMYTAQRALCLASWTDGPYSFTLLKHDQHRYMWLLRHPTLTEDSFTAYLFKDLTTDVTEQGTGSGSSSSSSHLRLDVVRDSPRPASSLCVDEYDVCSVWREPCTSGAQMALTCPRTCGICNASRPTICSFPPDAVGRWHDGVDGDAGSSVVIGQTSVVLETGSGAARETMRCIRWQEPSPTSSGRRRVFTRYLTEEMLVTEYTDGCRPRYQCARILKKSPAVMFFKLSRTITWPLTSSPANPIDCSNFDFDHAPEQTGDVFRDRYYRLLFSTERRNVTSCRLPADLNNYSVLLRDGTECRANVTETATGSDIVVSFASGCRLPENVANVTSFACIESSRLLPSGDLLIVTLDPSSSSSSSLKVSVYCWIFPKNSQTVFYQINGALCNEASRGRLRHHDALLLPVAVFSKFRRKFRKEGDDEGGNDVTISSQLDSPEISSSIQNNNQVLLEDNRSDGDLEVKVKPTTLADDPRLVESHFVTPNPFILLSVAAIFALVQFAYFCHHA